MPLNYLVEGWTVMILKRNGGVWFVEGSRNVIKMDAAQDGMFSDLHSQDKKYTS